MGCKYLSAACGGPVHTKEQLATGRPRRSPGIFFSFGARRRSILHFRSIGASAMKSLQNSSRRRMSAPQHSPSASVTDVSGWSLTSNSVTTPKLPPPPRRAQNKSGFSRELQRATEPSAVTRVKVSTLSQDNPKRRVSHPVPPPSTNPEAPVWETTPEGKTRPAFCVALSIDPSRQPPANLARHASESTVTWCILERSITRPRSQVPKPARL